MSSFLRLCTVTVAVLGAACGPAADPDPPVATPSVTLSRPDAAVGSPIEMTYRFVVAADAPAFTEDYWVFVHFLDADGELMWTDDHLPATPTRQWTPGATVDYARTMFIPKFPYTGAARVEVGLFSAETEARLPLAGQTSGMRSYTVATFNMRLQSDNVFVVFSNGWHQTEAPDDTTGLEWQWSRGLATLSFPNPRRDAVVFLQLDQPARAFAEPQQVELRLGSVVIGSFALPPGPRALKQFDIRAAQFGPAATVEMALSVDKTFVPASIPELRSSDERELGVRVFRAFVQPR